MADIKNIGVALNMTYTYGRHVWYGISSYALKCCDWRIVFVPSERKIREEHVGNFHLDGLIAQMTHFVPGALQTFWKDIPLINVSSAVYTDMTTICSDNREVGAMAAKYLLKKGCGHFCFYGEPHYKFSQDRYNGYVEIIEKETGIIPEFLSKKKTDFPSLIANMPKPLGLFAASDTIATSAIQQLQKTGFDFSETAILGVDNETLLCQTCNPWLSSVEQNSQYIGYRAAAALHQILKNPNQQTIDHIKIPPLQIRERASTLLKPNSSTVDKIMDLISETYSSSELTIEGLAERVGMCRRTMERHLRSSIGKSLLEVIKNYRVNAAKRMLSGTDYPIGMIASECGFSGQTRFAVIFKELEGITPGQFRRKHRAWLT